MVERRPPPSRDIVPRRTELVPRSLRDLARQLRYRHYEHASDPRWVSYASQRDVRDIAIDSRRNQIWLATWGGVLCIAPPNAIRHTSAHGLIGNATRAILVDDAGVVWAAGHHGGLCSLLPEENAPWRVHRELNSWKVLRMVSCPAGGIYVALRNDRGECLIHRVERKKTKKPKATAAGGLAVKEVEAMLVDRDGVLWTGNLWGLHNFRDGDTHTIEMDCRQICALAAGVGGGLWLGTNRGLQRWRPEVGPSRQPEWPLDEIVSLAEEPESGILWVATTREVGRIVNNVWQQVLSSPPDRPTVLRIANLKFDFNDTSEAGSISAWVGTANGLYRVGPDECKPIMTPHPEDALSNAVQCLSVGDSKLWMGTARALSSWDDERWRNHGTAGSQIRDVRALAAENGRLWIGAWDRGLHHWQTNQCAADSSLTLPIVSLCAAADGVFWAATVDAIYYRLADGEPWRELATPNLGSRIIQVICYQETTIGRKKAPILWIGTSFGLLRYQRDQNGTWAGEDAALEQSSIQSMALDPLTNRLWLGTSSGLFSESAWQVHHTGDIRALAFGPLPEGELLVGNSEKLELWPVLGKRDVLASAPSATFSFATHGLAAPEITALTVRINGNQREVWVGSPNGVSLYRVSSQA